MGTADYSSAQSTLLALMNSAPAELLHPLIDAALQPSLTKVFARFPVPGKSLEFRVSRHLPAAILGQKNASGYAGVGILLQKRLVFSKENAAKPDRIGVSGDNR